MKKLIKLTAVIATGLVAIVLFIKNYIKTHDATYLSGTIDDDEDNDYPISDMENIDVEI